MKYSNLETHDNCTNGILNVSNINPTILFDLTFDPLIRPLPHPHMPWPLCTQIRASWNPPMRANIKLFLFEIFFFSYFLVSNYKTSTAQHFFQQKNRPSKLCQLFDEIPQEVTRLKIKLERLKLNFFRSKLHFCTIF